jgi:hypothetical protein
MANITKKHRICELDSKARPTNKNSELIHIMEGVGESYGDLNN